MNLTLWMVAASSIALMCLAAAARSNADDVTRRIVERHGDTMRPSDLASGREVDLVGRVPVKIDPDVLERLRAASPGSEEHRAATREVGRAFLDHDRDLLAGREADWRERLVDTGDPTSAIRYDLYLRGILVEGSGLTLVIDSNTDEIRRLFMVDLNYSPALLAAVAAPHLTEEQVGEIIKPDLGPKPYYNWEFRRAQSTTDGGATLGRFTKIVVPEPPYVLWVAQTVAGKYRVDARTGAILDKEPPRGADR